MNRNNQYPLYDVFLKKDDGSDKLISKLVTLEKGIEAIKKFDHLLLANGKVKDYVYCYLYPRRDIKPHFNEATGNWVYEDDIKSISPLVRNARNS